MTLEAGSKQSRTTALVRAHQLIHLGLSDTLSQTQDALQAFHNSADHERATKLCQQLAKLQQLLTHQLCNEKPSPRTSDAVEAGNPLQPLSQPDPEQTAVNITAKIRAQSDSETIGSRAGTTECVDCILSDSEFDTPEGSPASFQSTEVGGLLDLSADEMLLDQFASMGLGANESRGTPPKPVYRTPEKRVPGRLNPVFEKALLAFDTAEARSVGLQSGRAERAAPDATPMPQLTDPCQATAGNALGSTSPGEVSENDSFASPDASLSQSGIDSFSRESDAIDATEEPRTEFITAGEPTSFHLRTSVEEALQRCSDEPTFEGPGTSLCISPPFVRQFTPPRQSPSLHSNAPQLPLTQADVAGQWTTEVPVANAGSPVPSQCLSSESISPVVAQSTVRKARRKFVLEEEPVKIDEGNDDSDKENAGPEQVSSQRPFSLREGPSTSAAYYSPPLTSLSSDDEADHEQELQVADLQERASQTRFISALESIDLDDEEEEELVLEEQNVASTPKPSTTRAKPTEKPMTAAGFKRIRNSLSAKLFAELNEACFGNQLPHDLQISWNNTLKTTAGLTHYRREHQPGKEDLLYSARVELSSKVVDSEYKLRNTLAHELCHVAAWVISHIAKPPHGDHFKRWTKRVVDKYPDMKEISTCHNYDIHMPHQWKCTNDECGSVVKRYSNSLDISKKGCGNCNSPLNYLGKFNANGTPCVKRGPNQYSLFIKEHFSAMKQKLPRESSNAEVMKALASQWKAKKTNNAAADEAEDVRVLDIGSTRLAF